MPEIEIPPGIVKSVSGATAIGRYIDADKVRFVAGKAENIGGWTPLNSVAMVGVPRAAHAYLAPSGIEVRAIGTEKKLYAMALDGSLDDITPFRAEDVALAVDPFAVVNLSTTVTVTDVAHDARVGDTAVFSGATAGGGITIVGSYVIVSVIDVDHYTIIHSAAATSTDATTGGAAVLVSYEVGIGTADAAAGRGYGVGPYGAELYGRERTTSFLMLDPRVWSLDNYGTSLLAAYQGSTIYLWDEEIDDRAVALAGAPMDVLFAFVTEERFIMALCADMWLKWPDRDLPTNWTPSDTSTANERRLASGSKLVAGGVLGQNLSAIWTDTSLYVAQFTGGEFVFDTPLVGTSCGLVGPGAFAIFDGRAFWMSRNAFHMFDGSVHPIPRHEEVSSWLFAHLNNQTVVKTIAFYNASFREVWFIQPATDDSEPSRYVAVNIDQYHWTLGTLDRVGETVEVSGEGKPLLASSDGYLYQHERVDAMADDALIEWTLGTGLWRIPGAKVSVDIFGFSPDFQEITGSITLDVMGKDRPQSSDDDTETEVIDATTEIVDLRVSGRYFSYSISGSGRFREGTHVLNEQTAGER